MGKRIYIRSGGSWIDITTASGPGPIEQSIIDAKGDLIAGSGADTPIRFAVGSDGQILAASSATASGLEWIDNVAEETRLLVKNQTGSTLIKGQVVYINGANGNIPTVALSQANTEAASSKTVGIVRQTIANNETGYVTLSGLLKNVDTQGFSLGQAVWLSASVAGGITNTRPTPPNHAVLIGYVPKVDANGEIFVMIQNGFELHELHNVNINTGALANGQVLSYDSTSGLWVNAVPSAGGVGLDSVFMLMGV